MADLHARLRACLQRQRIQLNVIASSPRQGGTMLLICLGCAELAEARQAIGLVNEPGNLGVLPGCRHDQTDNPRNEADMDRLLLITAQLAGLRWRLGQGDNNSDDGWIKRQRELERRLGQARIAGADGRYDPRFDQTLLADVEALKASLDHGDDCHRVPAADQPPLILTVKEHTYNQGRAAAACSSPQGGPTTASNRFCCAGPCTFSARQAPSATGRSPKW
ncbi:MAG: hypothetical protein ACK5E6_00635 [Cyanobacteriota bacterium]